MADVRTSKNPLVKEDVKYSRNGSIVGGTSNMTNTDNWSEFLILANQASRNQ